MTDFAAICSRRAIVAPVSPKPSFAARLRLAWQILGSADVAARVTRSLAAAEPAQLSAAPQTNTTPEPAKAADPKPAKVTAPKAASTVPPKPDASAALSLLMLFQREGRLVDFLEQEIDGFADEDVGAAARQVHAGCRAVLHKQAQVEPLRQEEEDSRVVIDDAYDANEIRLSGDVASQGPHRGRLRHRGWRVSDLQLPTRLAEHDATVIAAAEVEVGA